MPERLGNIHNHLGIDTFQIELRELILKPLAESIVKAAKANRDSKNCLPKEVCQIGRLGTLANPIVSFNVEALTSRLLAEPSGYFSTKCFVTDTARDSLAAKKNVLSIDKNSVFPDSFRRHVYHPHGDIETSGICVMTDKEYDSLDGKLAFQIGTHCAFGSHLAVVGMSFDDEYLRDQLTEFRSGIFNILWFTTREPEGELAKWCSSNDIQVVLIDSWHSFWQAVETSLPAPEENALLWTWGHLIAECFKIVNFPGATMEEIKFVKFLGASVKEDFFDQLYRKARIRGEDTNQNFENIRSIGPTPEQLDELMTILAPIQAQLSLENPNDQNH